MVARCCYRTITYFEWEADRTSRCRRRGLHHFEEWQIRKAIKFLKRTKPKRMYREVHLLGQDYCATHATWVWYRTNWQLLDEEKAERKRLGLGR